MISGLGIPASGMLAAQAKLAADAVNVANTSAPGAPRARVDLATTAAGGVTAHTAAVGPDQGDVVDDLTDLSVASGLYGANATVLRAQDETLKSVLDIVA